MNSSRAPASPGICRYGAYVPPTRLPIGAIGGGESPDGGPEKAVAWNDEDTITLAVRQRSRGHAARRNHRAGDGR